MEVTVVEAMGPPSRPVLAVHAGSVRRQAKLEVNQPFVIPHPHPGSEAACSVAVSLFQQLASHTLPEQDKAEAICSIPVRKPDGGKSEVKLRIRRGGAGGTQDGYSQKATDDVGLNREYLEHHKMESRIQTLILDVLREQPGDPYRYMLEQLRQYQANKKPAAAKCGRVLEKPIADEVVRSLPSPAAPAKAEEESEPPQPLVPRPPAVPRLPEQPKPAHTGRVLRNSGDGASSGKALPTPTPPTPPAKPASQAPRPRPQLKTAKSQHFSEAAAVENRGEAKLGAQYAIGQVLRMPACAKVAAEASKDEERVVFAKRLVRQTLSKARENCIAVANAAALKELAAAHPRAQAVHVRKRVYASAAHALSEEMRTKAGTLIRRLAFDGAVRISSADEHRAEKDLLTAEDLRNPMPIVLLGAGQSWSEWTSAAPGRRRSIETLSSFGGGGGGGSVAGGGAPAASPRSPMRSPARCHT